MSRLFSFRLRGHPRGLFAVVLGPDGSGKSTVTGVVAKRLEHEFCNVWRFHWRPQLLPKLGRRQKANDGPHPQSEAPPEVSKYRGVVSLMRFMYYWLDFVLGYWLVIYPRKARATLILGERYYPDVIVHPARYGFSVPHRLMRLLAKFVPSPDILILLKNEPEVIYARKPELSVLQIKSQISGYERELSFWKRSETVITEGNVEDVADKVCRIILDVRAQHSEKRSRCKYSGYHNLEYRTFPLWGRGRLLVGRNNAIRRSLALYHPSSVMGLWLRKIAMLLGDASRYLLLRKPSVDDFAHFPLKKSEQIIAEVVDRKEPVLSFFLGNPGPRRKVTAQISDEKTGVIAYAKIGTGNEIAALLRNEADMLMRLTDLPSSIGRVPGLIRLVEQDGWTYLFTTPPGEKTEEHGFELTDVNERFARVVFQKTACRIPLDEYDKGHKITERLGRIPDLDEIRECAAIARSAWDAIQADFSEEKILVGTCHGDFAPWNIFKLRDGSIFVFDWEYGTTKGPALADLCHFLRMPRHLVWGWPACRTVRAFLDWKSREGLSLVQHANALEIPERRIKSYILLYLLQEFLRHAGTGDGSMKALRASPVQAVLMQYLANCMEVVVETAGKYGIEKSAN